MSSEEWEQIARARRDFEAEKEEQFTEQNPNESKVVKQDIS